MNRICWVTFQKMKWNDTKESEWEKEMWEERKKNTQKKCSESKITTFWNNNVMQIIRNILFYRCRLGRFFSFFFFVSSLFISYDSQHQSNNTYFTLYTTHHTRSLQSRHVAFICRQMCVCIIQHLYLYFLKLGMSKLKYENEKKVKLLHAFCFRGQLISIRVLNLYDKGIHNTH